MIRITHLFHYSPYFPNLGVQIKVFGVTNLKGKRTDILSNYIIENLKKLKLLDKIIAFSGDNCNNNSGGVLRKGTKNVLSILNNNLKTNVYGGCSCLYNTMQSNADMSPVNVEIII